MGAEGLQHSSRREGEMEIPDLSGVASSSTSVPRFVFAHQDPGRRYRDDREILLEHWTEAYRSSTQWESDAIAIFDGGSWPTDFQVWQNKLFRDGRILVPEKLVRRVIVYCGRAQTPVQQI